MADTKSPELEVKVFIRDSCAEPMVESASSPLFGDELHPIVLIQSHFKSKMSTEVINGCVWLFYKVLTKPAVSVEGHESSQINRGACELLTDRTNRILCQQKTKTLNSPKILRWYCGTCRINTSAWNGKLTLERFRKRQTVKSSSWLKYCGVRCFSEQSQPPDPSLNAQILAPALFTLNRKVQVSYFEAGNPNSPACIL